MALGATWKSLRRTTPTIAPIAHRSLLSVTGSQCSEFLNGLLSTAIHHPPQNQFSALLHAQGRVMHDVFLYASPTKDGYILEYDTCAPSTRNALDNSVPALQSYLRRHILRSKVKLRDVTPEFDVWASWGSPADLEFETEAPRSWIWERSGVVEPDWSREKSWPWGTMDGVILDRRGVSMGRRMLVRKGEKPREVNTHDVVPTEEYTLHRILTGVPEGTQDIVPMQAFPMECNLDVMGGLDFRKGCYVGQELTVRTYHTGVIRKRITPVEIIPPDQASPGTWTPIPTNIDIKPIPIPSHQNDNRGPRPRGAGKLLSTYLNNNCGFTGGVGLALLRLDHVSAWEKGSIRLEFETDSGNGKKWEVRPWLPQWWPKVLVDSR